MTRQATERVPVGIVHLAPDNSGAPAAVAVCRRIRIDRTLAHVALVSVATFARRHAGLPGPRRIEERALKLKRLDNLPSRKLIKRRADKLLEQKAKHDETEIAVNNSLAGFLFKRFVGDRRERAFRCSRQEVKWPPGAQSRSVRQQIANRDLMFVRAIKLGQVLRDRAVECQFGGLNSAGAEQ